MLTNGWGRGSRKAAAETFGLDFEGMDSRRRMTFDTFEIGKLSGEDYLARTVFHEPRGVTPADFTAFALSRSQPYPEIQPYPEMIELVRQLRKKYGLRIAVVSNEGRELTEHRIREFRLHEFVDFVCSSCFVHLRKPDVDIYRMALDMAHVEPSRVVDIDDRTRFTELACRLGVRCIHHRSLESTRAELEKWGLTLP